MPLREGTSRAAVVGALGLDRRSVEVQRGISKFHNRRYAVVEKLEAVQNLQDNSGSKTRSRTHEVEEYNCMPYMQLTLLEWFRPTYDSRERGLEVRGSKKRVRGAKAVKERAAQNPASQEPSGRVYVGTVTTIGVQRVPLLVNSNKDRQPGLEGRARLESERVSRSESQKWICDERRGEAWARSTGAFRVG